MRYIDENHLNTSSETAQKIKMLSDYPDILRNFYFQHPGGYQGTYSFGDYVGMCSAWEEANDEGNLTGRIHQFIQIQTDIPYDQWYEAWHYCEIIQYSKCGRHALATLYEPDAIPFEVYADSSLYLGGQSSVPYVRMNDNTIFSATEYRSADGTLVIKYEKTTIGDMIEQFTPDDFFN